MSRANAKSLPFADAATIVRANQKDNYFRSRLNSQIQELARIIKGQRFVNLHPQETATLAKTVYYLVTTGFGARTLGEEYVDIMHVTRSGKRFPSLLSRILFTASFAGLPYIVTKITQRLKGRSEATSFFLSRYLTSYPTLLDTIMNIHVALFYFEGSFYAISKRVLGMRYVFGHNKDQKKLQANGNYAILGSIIMAQLLLKLLLKLNQHSKLAAPNDEKSDYKPQQEAPEFKSLKQLENIGKYVEENEDVYEKVAIDLSDPEQLPYIPTNSRSCMLCLSPMVNPSAANCGHFFCWSCIADWIRDHPECPLCRQTCLEQSLLPLR
ncbi:hypothetical protein OXX69_005114 [Metschnikowia pulcherrima]